MANTAADAIRRITNMIAPLAKAAELLDEYESFDNAIREKKTIMVKLQADVESTRADIESAKIDAKSVREKSAELISKTKIDAEQILADAKVKATEIRDKAHATAERILADAKSTVAAETKAFEKRASMARVECERREEKLAALDEAIKEKDEVIRVRAKRLDDLDARIKRLLEA